MASKLFQPRRIGVCGGSHGLTQEAVSFCQGLGRRLARDSLVTVVSGGAKHRSSAPANDLAADWWIVNTAQSDMRKEEVFERVITVVREDPTRTNGCRLSYRHGATARRTSKFHSPHINLWPCRARRNPTQWHSSWHGGLIPQGSARSQFLPAKRRRGAPRIARNVKSWLLVIEHDNKCSSGAPCSRVPMFSKRNAMKHSKKLLGRRIGIAAAAT